jgi:hypothetical protein
VDDLNNRQGVTRRVVCWACNDSGWVQRGSEIVQGALFSRNYQACITCGGSKAKEASK